MTRSPSATGISSPGVDSDSLAPEVTASPRSPQRSAGTSRGEDSLVAYQEYEARTSGQPVTPRLTSFGGWAQVSALATSHDSTLLRLGVTSDSMLVMVDRAARSPAVAGGPSRATECRSAQLVSARRSLASESGRGTSRVLEYLNEGRLDGGSGHGAWPGSVPSAAGRGVAVHGQMTVKTAKRPASRLRKLASADLPLRGGRYWD